MGRREEDEKKGDRLASDGGARVCMRVPIAIIDFACTPTPRPQRDAYG